MRRWLTRILFCLLLGAVTTVAVAWALALTMPKLDGLTSNMMPVGTERPRWAVRTARDLSALDVDAIADWELDWPPGVEINEIQMPRWSRAAHPPTRREAEIHSVVLEYARGWPMLSLYWRETYASSRHTEWGWEIEVARRFTKDHNSRTMPLAVIWPGFLIDSFFYGAVWFGLLFGFVAARRGLRKKRGLCPMCAYDLRGCPAGSRASPRGCPECGWGREEAR